MRLQIGRNCDLAIKALRHLAADSEPWGTEALADRVSTTPGFLGPVLASFERTGWVESTLGGYRYAASPAPSLLEVIEAIEGPTRRDACVLHEGKPCGVASGEPFCALHEAWQQAHQVLIEHLGATAAV